MSPAVTVAGQVGARSPPLASVAAPVPDDRYAIATGYPPAIRVPAPPARTGRPSASSSSVSRA